MYLPDAPGRVLDEGGAKAQLQRVEGGWSWKDVLSVRERI